MLAEGVIKECFIVVTETFEEDLKWFEAVLDKITQANLTVNPEKCEFCRSQVKHLGYIVNRDGLSVNSEKTETILAYPFPKNIKQFRRFIGLTQLFRSNVKWNWGEEQHQALDWLKGALKSAPILAFPSFKDIVANPFHIQTDASNSRLDPSARWGKARDLLCESYSTIGREKLLGYNRP